jgi:hypothetical protein
MDTRNPAPSVAASYVAAADDALAEATRARTRWSDAGELERVALVDTLIGFLIAQRDKARHGELPPSRDAGYGFALTRFMDDYEWRPEGDDLLKRVHAMQDIWRRSADDVSQTA